MEDRGYVETSNKFALKSLSLWVAEAEFGRLQLRNHIRSLEPNSSILEVGCGSGILISMLAEEFLSHNFTGIEPYGKGFSSLKDLRDRLQANRAKLITEGYENYQPKSKYDLIYCLNVFEHVADWRHFLTWAAENLNEGGVFLVFCPNYIFPYEPHFRIPIVANKALTYRIFKRRIEKYEEVNGTYGLWESLNFVKKNHVRKFCEQTYETLRLSMYDDLTIVDDMIMRHGISPEFRARQRVIGNIAIFIKKLGLFSLIKKIPLLLPYMKLVFKKS